jgi:heptosyltransferase III
LTSDFRILVLRGGALGDLVLTLPVLEEIRRSYPSAEVTLFGIFPQARLATPEFVDRVDRLDAADLVPLFVDGPMPWPIRRRLQGFDLAISFLSDPTAIIARNLAAAGIKQVVTSTDKTSSHVHAVFRLANVLGPLGLTLRNPVPRLAGGPKTSKFVRFGFHLGSGSPRKNWPIDQWVELTERLDDCFDDFLLVGGETDDQLVREFRKRRRQPRLETLLHATLADLCQALKDCTIFVGHDTGVAHLAAALGVPTVALFGPTDAAIWAPLGEHVRVILSPNGLMESIEVRNVFECLSEMRSRLPESNP